MNRTAKSFRGESVNFDLFDIKNQILQAPSNETSKAREKFINKKRRRTNKQKIAEVLAAKQQTSTPPQPEIEVELPTDADELSIAEDITPNRKVRIKK